MALPKNSFRRRALFLDVDGTYAHHGVVPAAHVAAVRAARAAGHVVFLCTGRPVSLLSPHLLEAGFDGIVAGAGGHVTLLDRPSDADAKAEPASETILDIRFSLGLAARTLALLDEAKTHYILETPEGTFANSESLALLAERAALSTQPEYAYLGALVDIVAALEARDDLAGIAFTKATAFAGTRPMTEIVAELGDEVAMFPSSIADLGMGSGELYLATVNKATGMEAAIARLGIPREDTVAFGDNLNDLEMIEYAGIGVAMASGVAEVIAVADVVTPGPEHDGLATAFVELGLIAPPA